MENQTEENRLPTEEELLGQIRSMLQKGTVEHTLAWLSSMYGMQEAIAIFREFRKTEAEARGQSSTSL